MASSLITPALLRFLQVPCTILSGLKLFGLERNRYVSSLLDRVRLGPRWLRVSPSNTADQLIDICSSAVLRFPHLNLMSHSSEFMPGGSPC